MLIHRFLPLVVATSKIFRSLCEEDNINIGPSRTCVTDAITTDLLDWLQENGAYINEKVAVQQVVMDDGLSTRGVFATDNMDVGETVCRIPYELLFKPSNKAADSDCETIQNVKDAMSMSGENITPYARYLLEQQRDYTAMFWSRAAKDLLLDMLHSRTKSPMTKYDELPPHGVDEYLKEEVTLWCGGDLNDTLYRHAVMLVKSRADYQYLVPFYDLHNHHNGKVNLRHRYDPYKEPIDELGYEIITSKQIKKYEELYLSYNQELGLCDQFYDWFGTPEMCDKWMHFGFVEPMPQRWLFDFARVKFDLDWKDGTPVVNFLVSPSERGIALLQDELTRLNIFSETHRSKTYKDYEGMTQYEWESLWQYFDALHDAITYAIQSDVKLNDDIWNKGDDWWVEGGTLKASQTDEHWVYPTK